MVAASSYMSGLQNISASDAFVDSSSWGGAIGKQKGLIEEVKGEHVMIWFWGSFLYHLNTEIEFLLLMELFHSEISWFFSFM